jgi:putative hemolysin
MGGLRIGEALRTEVLAMKKFNSNLMMLGLSALALMLLFIPLSLAQDGASDAAHAYCVKMGYLYKSSPGLNNGEGVCQFSDQSWCDAQAFYSGACGPRLNANAFPVQYYGPTMNVVSGDASQLCRSRGGTVRSVHTPYGDVLMCVFPDGTTCDLQALATGRCGDKWFTYAYNWLNAP